ncbi:hypothetical protein VNI00_014773 [Paramarasmius palmivorus]|uniref:Uncharacterized protein n=1 Tax=Paramarasmius palmivorus TaxID=297713 RepID=A0AAW0BQM8_9AGAR
MDGNIQRKTYPQDYTPPEGYSGYLMHHVFYENTALSPGNHALVVNVTSITPGGFGTDFNLDYITYKPSFASVTEKPPFIRGSESQQISRGTRLPIGAIIGISIGGVSLLLVPGLLFFFRRRRMASRKESETASTVDPFATHLGVSSKPKPSKWAEAFPSQNGTDTAELADEGIPHLPPPWSTMEVRRRNEEITALSAQMEHSDNPTRGELFARINILTMEVERLVRENAPPEYGGSDAGQRPNSDSGTLPSYDHLERS